MVAGGEVLAALLHVAPGPADLVEVLAAALQDIDVRHREPPGVWPVSVSGEIFTAIVIKSQVNCLNARLFN